MKTVCSWVEQIGYDEMIDFEYLTDNKLVQKSTFSSGKSIVVNFGNEAYNESGLRKLPSVPPLRRYEARGEVREGQTTSTSVDRHGPVFLPGGVCGGGVCDLPALRV